MLGFASWRPLAALVGILVVAGCAQQKPVAMTTAPQVRVAPQLSKYDVYFDTNHSKIDAKGEETMHRMLNDIRHHGVVNVTIVGKADTVGSAKANMALSRARANRVRDALIASGEVPASNIHTSWTGDRNPPVPTGDNVAEAHNRVVEVVVEGPATAAVRPGQPEE